MIMDAVYVATVNVPGYLPECEPVAFDTAWKAWRYLADERKHDEDQDDMPLVEDYSDTYHALVQLGDAVESQPGVVYAGTPGSDSPHDLGLAYSVSLVPHADYPHEPGRLPDCRACEARCHCTPGSAECVYGGEHDA